MAAYAGTATGSKIGSYTARFCYSGEVVKTLPGTTIYTVVYRGQPIPAPEPEVKTNHSLFPVILTSFLVGLAAVALAMAGSKVCKQFISKKRPTLAEGPGEDTDESPVSGLWAQWKDRQDEDTQPDMPPVLPDDEQGKLQPLVPADAEPEPEDVAIPNEPKKKTRPRRSRIPKDEMPLVVRLDDEMEEKSENQ